MNLEYYISGLSEAYAAPGLLNLLKSICPEGRFYHSFDVILPQGDPRLGKLLRAIFEAGRTLWKGTREIDRRSEFVLRIHRSYTSEELLACEYLRFQPSEYLLSHDVKGREVFDRDPAYRDQTINVGRIQLEPQYLREELNFASATVSGLWPVVPDRVKRLLESARLRHVVFKPTVLVRRNRRTYAKKILDWKTHGSPWWELGSDLLLPPRLPDVTSDEIVSLEDILQARNLPDWLYSQPEYRYSASDLEACEAFDFAHMHEGWAPNLPHLHERSLIASRRFYQFCMDRDLKATWVPVHVQAG